MTVLRTFIERFISMIKSQKRNSAKELYIWQWMTCDFEFIDVMSADGNSNKSENVRCRQVKENETKNIKKLVIRNENQSFQYHQQRWACFYAPHFPFSNE